MMLIHDGSLPPKIQFKILSSGNVYPNTPDLVGLYFQILVQLKMMWFDGEAYALLT